ncbi:olpB [Scenedesmus sp. PABB004]|nr:olpB [Scenedesmus sp. PABB004]
MDRASGGAGGGGPYAGQRASYVALSAITILALALLCSIWSPDVGGSVALLGLLAVYLQSQELLMLFLVFAPASILVDWLRLAHTPHDLRGRGWLIFLALLGDAAKVAGAVFAWALHASIASGEALAGGYGAPPPPQQASYTRVDDPFATAYSPPPQPQRREAPGAPPPGPAPLAPGPAPAAPLHDLPTAPPPEAAEAAGSVMASWRRAGGRSAQRRSAPALLLLAALAACGMAAARGHDVPSWWRADQLPDGGGGPARPGGAPGARGALRAGGRAPAGMAAAAMAARGRPLLQAGALPYASGRSLLQAGAFPYASVDMVPTASTCNATGNATIELLSTYAAPVNSTWCFRVWEMPGITGASLGEIAAPLSGKTDASASFVNVQAMGFEVGKNCSGSVATASLRLANGTAVPVSAANAVFTTAQTTGKLNLTLDTPVGYDNAANATLCVTLRAPCGSLEALCAYGNATSCRTFVSVMAYRQKQSCAAPERRGSVHGGRRVDDHRGLLRRHLPKQPVAGAGTVAQPCAACAGAVAQPGAAGGAATIAQPCAARAGTVAQPGAAGAGAITKPGVAGGAATIAKPCAAAGAATIAKPGAARTGTIAQPGSAAESPSPSPGPAAESPSPSPGPAAESPLPSPGPPAESPSPSPGPPAESPSPSPAPPAESPSPSPGPAAESPAPSPEPAAESPAPSPEPPAESPSPSPGPAAESPLPSPGPPAESPSPSPGPPAESPSPSPAPPAESPSPSPGPAAESPAPSPGPPAESPSPSPGPPAESPSPSPAPPAESPSPSPGPAAESPAPSPGPPAESPSPSPGPPAESPSPSPAPPAESPSPSPGPAAESPSPSPEPPAESPSPSAGPAEESPSPSAGPAEESPSPSAGPAEESPSPSPEPVVESPSPAPGAVAAASPSPAPSSARPSSPAAPAPTSSLPDLPVFVSAPSVLAPLPPLNDTGIHVRGGSVSITGIQVQAAGPVAPAPGAASPGLRSRWAAFNGTLGFLRLGVGIDIAGDFQLERSMDWSYDAPRGAWTTRVGMLGTFHLVHEEVSGTAVSRCAVAPRRRGRCASRDAGQQQLPLPRPTLRRAAAAAQVRNSTLNPSVAGDLTLFSSVWPGPGFSGCYDWSGALELDPNPFVVWPDAAALLGGAHARRLTAARASSSPSSSGLTPVQGRVSVRESGSAAAAAAAGGADNSTGVPVVPLDDADEIRVVGGPAPPGSQACGGGAVAQGPLCVLGGGQQGKAEGATSPAPAAEGAGAPAAPPGGQGLAGLLGVSPTTLIIIIAVGAPLALVACVAGVVAAAARRRRQREAAAAAEARQRAPAQREAAHGAAAAAGASADDGGAVVRRGRGGRAVRRRLPSTAGAAPASADGAAAAAAAGSARGGRAHRGRVPGHPGVPELEGASCSGSSGSSCELDEDGVPVLGGGAAATAVEFLEPGEAGLSDSLCGGSAARLPRRDSEGLVMLEGAGGHHRQHHGLRDSLAGMASGLAAALGLRGSSAGAAYRAPPVLRGASLDLAPPPGAGAARPPTLPGARRRSGDEAQAAAAACALRAAGVMPAGEEAAGVGAPHRARQGAAAGRPVEGDAQQQRSVPAQWLLPARGGAGARQAFWAGRPPPRAARLEGWE